MKNCLLAEAFERSYVRPLKGKTLVVGSFITEGKEDRRARHAEAIGVDMRPGPGVDLVLNLEGALPAGLGPFAHIECCSVLEHSRAPWLLAENLERLLVPGGTLFLTVPFIWRVHEYPADLFRFTDQGVRALFPGIEWRQLMYASNKLRPDHYVRALDDGMHPYLPRTEVVGFGVRR